MSSIVFFSWFWIILINWMLGLLLLDYKIGYLLLFFFATDTIDDLILYLGSEEEHALDF